MKTKAFEDLSDQQREEVLELCLGNVDFAVKSMMIDSLDLFVKIGSIYSGEEHESGKKAALRILQIRMEGS